MCKYDPYDYFEACINCQYDDLQKTLAAKDAEIALLKKALKASYQFPLEEK